MCCCCLQTNLPLAFTDYSAVASCNPSDVNTFLTNLASTLGVSNSLTAGCQLSGTTSNTGFRRHARKLTQICANEAIQLSVQVRCD